MSIFDNDFERFFNDYFLDPKNLPDDAQYSVNGQVMDKNEYLKYLADHQNGTRHTTNSKQTKPEIGLDLVKQAKEGKFDPVIGRDHEIDEVIEILARRKKNNPVLIGAAGVGKTAIVEGLAQRINEGKVPDKLKDTKIIEVNINDLVAGSELRGAFEARLKKIIDQARKDPKTILFIDELHNLVGAGATNSEDHTGDAANILKPALASGDLRLIGATTTSEFRTIEQDSALARRFQPIQVAEPDVATSIKILQGLKPRYEKYHQVTYTDDALKTAAELSNRYITDRHLPDKAIDLLDEAGAKKELATGSTTNATSVAELEKEKAAAVKAEDYAKAHDLQEQIRQAKDGKTVSQAKDLPKVTAKDMYALIEQKTKIPMSELHQDEGQKNQDLSNKLKSVVIDQDKAINAITSAIARKQVFKDTNRPTGSFLLAGPTGVGKTELAKQLAVQLFGSEEHLIRLDMSEYQDATAVNKLIGSAPGYIGYGEGGQLTEKVRHQPYSLILFDEIEKANPQVFNALLQIMDDGRLTDASGHTVSFKDTILIMTSNAGFNGEKSDPKDEDELNKILLTYFRPEFLNRLDGIILFNSLTKADMSKIVQLYLNKVKLTLAKHKSGVKLAVDKDAAELLAKAGYSEKFGARPLRRVVEQKVETPIALALTNDSSLTDIKITAKDGKLQLNGKDI